MIDLVYRRYNDPMSIKAMPFEDGIRLFNYAKDQEREDRIFQRYLVSLHFMIERRIQYRSFETYRDDFTGKNIDVRSNDEIIADIEATHGIKLEFGDIE